MSSTQYFDKSSDTILEFIKYEDRRFVVKFVNYQDTVSVRRLKCLLPKKIRNEKKKITILTVPDYSIGPFKSNTADVLWYKPLPKSDSVRMSYKELKVRKMLNIY